VPSSSRANAQTSSKLKAKASFDDGYLGGLEDEDTSADISATLQAAYKGRRTTTPGPKDIVRALMTPPPQKLANTI
jgi:hypothetical protein